MKTRYWLVIPLLVGIAGTAFWLIKESSESIELASVTSNPLTEFSDYDHFTLEWNRVVPYGPSHQTLWMEISAVAHCEATANQEMTLLESSQEVEWASGMNSEIPGFHPAHLTKIDGRLINDVARNFNIQMQNRGCPEGTVKYDLIITTKAKFESGEEKEIGSPEKIAITRSQNDQLQTGNSHPLSSGIGSWQLTH